MIIGAIRKLHLKNQTNSSYFNIILIIKFVLIKLKIVINIFLIKISVAI